MRKNHEVRRYTACDLKRQKPRHCEPSESLYAMTEKMHGCAYTTIAFYQLSALFRLNNETWTISAVDGWLITSSAAIAAND
jgi:hypothetical protein